VEFLARFAAAFPDLNAGVRSDDDCRPDRVAAVLRRATEEAVDSGSGWAAERHFRFVEDMLWDPEPEVREALEVSYLKALATGELTAVRYKTFQQRMPASLRAVLIRHRRDWL
jgi:hypothetical protein